MTGLGVTGPRGARADYEVSELLPQVGGQGYMLRARLTSDRLGSQFAGADVALKQLFAGAVGATGIEAADRAFRPRSHPHLGRQLEVFSGPPPAPLKVDNGEVEVDVEIDGRDTDESEDVTYVAAVWVPGLPLLDAARGQDLDVTLRWIRQIATAIDFLHSPVHDGGPVCHRDVKPSNIIVTPDNEAVLIDPGLARPVAFGATGTPHGSPGYIPPECRKDPARSGPAGDRWQLGATLFTLLVGEPPRPAGDAVERQLRSALRRAHHPSALAAPLLEMLQAEPDARPNSATEWALALERTATPRRPRLRRPVTIAAAAVILVTLAGGAIIAEATDRDRPTRVVLSRSVPPGHPASPIHVPLAAVHETVTVYNKVTDGATAMREDSPAYLSTAPANFCKRDGCAIAGTDAGTGVSLTATCQTVAAVTTNGDDTTATDAHNPGRWTSDRWYGIRLPDGRFGYLSEVWVAAEDRGGLGLPQC